MRRIGFLNSQYTGFSGSLFLVLILSTAQCTRGLAGFMGESDPNLARIRMLNNAPVYLSTMPGAVDSVELQWEATQSGIFSVYLNGSCSAGTPLPVAGSGYIEAGTKAKIPLHAADLDIGNNTLTICLTVDKTSVVKAVSHIVVRDDVPPVSTAFPGSGAFAEMPAVTLNCSDNCLKLIYTLDNSDPDIAADGRILNGFVYSNAIQLPSATTNLKVLAVDKAGNREAVIRTEAYQQDFVPNLAITNVTRSKMSVNGYSSSQIDFTTDRPGLPYTLRLDTTDCSSGTIITSGTTTATTSLVFTAANLTSVGTHTLRICGQSLLGNFGAISTTIDRSDAAPTASITPAVSNHTVSVPAPVISCTPAAGAVIAYTINGATPVIAADGTITTGTAYAGPLTLQDQLQSIVRARCRDAYGNLSALKSQIYNVDTDNGIVLTLSATKTLAAGTTSLVFDYTSTRNNIPGRIQADTVTTCFGGTTLSSPTGNLSALVSSLVSTDNTTVGFRLAARKVSGDCVFSNSIAITRDDSPAVITSNLASGPYMGAQSVTLVCADNCTNMAYTVDGSAPDINPDGTINHGMQYLSPIAIPSASLLTLRVAASDQAQRVSTATFDYSTDAPQPVPISTISLDTTSLSSATQTATWVWNAGAAGLFWTTRKASSNCSDGTVLQSGVTNIGDTTINVFWQSGFTGILSIRLCVTNGTATEFVIQGFSNSP